MGNLSLEKLLKALVVKKTKARSPFSHSLPYLAEKSNELIPEEVYDNLWEFMEFHFEARYPEATKAFYKKCTKPFTAQKLKDAESILKRVSARLKKL